MPQPPQGASKNMLAWNAHDWALARWAEARLVNRTDAWGGYRPAKQWDKEYHRQDGTTGKLGRTTTRKGRLTAAMLARHFRAGGRADLVGLHSTSQDNTSLWGGVDIDCHGPTSTAAEINYRAALAWHDHLRRTGFRPLLTDSNGAGGFHLLTLLAGPIPTPRIYHFLQQLVGDHARHGMTRPPETFPKQAALRHRTDGRTPFGNWLRLPGRHHTRDHWSRVWDGVRWLDGAQAVDFILSLTGDDPGLVPDVPKSTPAPGPAARSRSTPSGTSNGDSRAARAGAYLARLPNLGEGQGRDDVAYQFAAFLVRDLELSSDVALAWLVRWDAGNRPPKGETALAEIRDNAMRYGKHAFGCGLSDTSPHVAMNTSASRVRAVPRGRGYYSLSFTIEVQ